MGVADVGSWTASIPMESLGGQQAVRSHRTPLGQGARAVRGVTRRTGKAELVGPQASQRSSTTGSHSWTLQMPLEVIEELRTGCGPTGRLRPGAKGKGVGGELRLGPTGTRVLSLVRGWLSIWLGWWWPWLGTLAGLAARD